jgi:Putative zinc-finger
MNCERYQKWILDLAFGALDDSRRTELSVHLAGCLSCREALAAERRLVSAIDQGIVARVQGAPSVDFAAQVRRRLAESDARAGSRFRWQPALWVPALAGAALALFLLSVWNARQPVTRRVQAPKPQVARITAPTAPSNSNLTQPERVKATRPPAALHATAPAARRGAACCAPDSEAPQLQVQIQPGQWAAVKSLYRAGQAGRVDETDKPVPADELLQVQPVDVAPLAVAELQEPKPVGTDER